MHLTNQIPQSNHGPWRYLEGSYLHNMLFKPVLQTEVSTIINYLKGWDDMAPKQMKTVTKFISEPLTHLRNISMTKWVFPRESKVANIIPLFISGNAMCVNNYRPISILPVLSKVYEKNLFNRLSEYLKMQNILCNSNCGFREKHSSYMALITLVDRLSEALEKGETVIGLFLDFSKAFDTVDHEIL